MDDLTRYKYNEEKIKELHGSVRPMAREFLNLSEAEGFKLRITHAYRSSQEQDALYAKGRTAPGKIVTNAPGGFSFHNFRLAFDVYDHKLGWSTNWDRLGQIGIEVGLEWGDRGFVDKPHFQYRGGLSLKQVQHGERPSLLDKYDNGLTDKEMEQLDNLEKRVAKNEKRLDKQYDLIKKVQQKKFGLRRTKQLIKKMLRKD